MREYKYGAVSAKQEKNMEATLLYWFEHPTAAFIEIANACGISDVTFYHFRKNPAYMEEHKNQLRNKFDALEDKAIAGLEKQIDDENWKAIEFVLKAQGYNGEDKVALSAKDTININIE